MRTATMKFLSAIVSLAVMAAAAPGSEVTKRQGALTGPIPAGGQIECDDTSRAYCFDEVVWGKGQDYQTLLYGYCKDQFADDALSCHGCMREPFPTDDCEAAPGAWNSAFICGEDGYKFAYRCDNWCSEGACV